MMTNDQIDEAIETIDDLAVDYVQAPVHSDHEAALRQDAIDALHRAAHAMRMSRSLIEEDRYQPHND